MNYSKDFSDLRAAFNHAISLHQAGELEGAEQIYRKILAVKNNHADTLHLLGVIEYQKNNPGEAIKLIRKAININPGFAEYHNNLGNALLSINKHNKAINEYRKVLELDPGHTGAYLNLGNALSDSGQDHDAINVYKHLISLAPDYVSAYHNLGHIYRNRNMSKEAIDCFRRAVAREPDRDDLWISFAFTLCGYRFDGYDPDIYSDLLACFDKSFIDYQDLQNAAISILKKTGQYSAFIQHFDSENTAPDILTLENRESITRDSLFLELLRCIAWLNHYIVLD